MKSVGVVRFRLDLPATFEREGDWIVGCFPHIDVASQGATQEEAERNLIEAAQLFIEACFERNELEAVLKACGFRPGNADDLRDQHILTVPVELLAARNGSHSIAC